MSVKNIKWLLTESEGKLRRIWHSITRFRPEPYHNSFRIKSAFLAASCKKIYSCERGKSVIFDASHKLKVSVGIQAVSVFHLVDRDISIYISTENALAYIGITTKFF